MSATNIFARDAADGRQHLAYGMTLSAGEELAMILPLPVPEGAPDDAVAFIDLSGYAKLFDDLAQGFPEPQARNAPRGAPAPAVRAPLAVVEVGSFEASFVPTRGDFDRLDARFRLPVEIWSSLPGYASFGFAVFKLKKGKKRIHPMAFTFPRKDPSALFFPTVHIHDGKVHSEATFDHALFCQRRPPVGSPMPEGWSFSASKAAQFVNVAKAGEIIDGDQLVYRLRLKGRAPNRDVHLED